MFAYCGNCPVTTIDSGGCYPVHQDADGNTVVDKRTRQLKPISGTADDIGNHSSNFTPVDDYFDMLLVLHAQELEAYYAGQYEFYYNATLGDSQFAEEYAFYDAVLYFVGKVMSNADWDLKKDPPFHNRDDLLYKGNVYSGADLGNIHYGYVGSVLFTKGVLHAGAGAYQIVSGTSTGEYWPSYFDDPRDYDMVAYGIQLYQEEHRK